MKQSLLFFILISAFNIQAQEMIVALDKPEKVPDKICFYIQSVDDNRDEYSGTNIIGKWTKGKKETSVIFSDTMDRYLLEYIRLNYPPVLPDTTVLSLRINVFECSLDPGFTGDAKVNLKVELVSGETGETIAEYQFDRSHKTAIVSEKTYEKLLTELIAVCMKEIDREVCGTN